MPGCLGGRKLHLRQIDRLQRRTQKREPRVGGQFAPDQRPRGPRNGRWRSAPRPTSRPPCPAIRPGRGPTSGRTCRRRTRLPAPVPDSVRADLECDRSPPAGAPVRPIRPRRASLYAGRPRIFRAEKAGGRCSIRPTKRRGRRLDLLSSRHGGVRQLDHLAFDVFGRARVGRGGRCPCIAWASAARTRSSRVAPPTQTTNTPVASGSSVPAWPALAGRARRSTTSTACREVMPAGFFRLSRPASGVSHGSRCVCGDCRETVGMRLMYGD